MTSKSSKLNHFDTDALDTSQLTGLEIRIFPEQAPGRPIYARVLEVMDRLITIDSARNPHVFESLVHRQKTTLQLPYRGEAISVRATLLRGPGGNIAFELEDKASPLSQRKFIRLELELPVHFAAYSMTVNARRSLSTLRWIETRSMNVSSGGILLPIPGTIESGVHMLLNIDWEGSILPSLLLGRVCYCCASDDKDVYAGVEFITSEIAQKLVPASVRTALPGSVFKYSEQLRNKLNRKLIVWNPEKESLFTERNKNEDR